MNSPKSQISNFEERIKIEKQIGDNHGYRLENICYSPPAQSKKQYSSKIVLNDSFTPMEVSQSKRITNKKLQQLAKEMEQIEVQRKVSEMAHNQDKTDFNVLDLVNQKIKEYNFLIDHKNFIFKRKAKSHFEAAANATKKQQKQRYVILLDKIKAKKKDLIKVDSLSSQFKTNQEITKIYRQYSLSMKLSDRSSDISTLMKSKKSESKTKLLNISDSKIVLNIKNSDHKLAPLYNRYDQQIDVKYPVIEKQLLQSSQQMNKSTTRNKLINRAIKEKVNQLRAKSLSQIIDSSKFDKLKEQAQSVINNIDYSKEYNKISSRLSNINSNKNRKEQQAYLSAALERRSPKFIKAEGSKFLLKFSCDKLAKEMLEGKQFVTAKQQKVIKPKPIIKPIKVPPNLNEEDKMVMGLMIEQQSDAYYWTTCRNQKLNLMLKGKRHQ